ncbi:MAG TPA: hypothetical protein VGV07_17985 [Devosia sp.]|jgi:hypothetical protein|uniref:hypothetical protein n=1 Tax=Devosia sp. TaxID=1871048 RepID=UPI002DDDB550|nr:hypothetical protein [Devosia sp.]HEV2517149.1 hypothetical protein [Devosia sp.]
MPFIPQGIRRLLKPSERAERQSRTLVGQFSGVTLLGIGPNHFAFSTDDFVALRDEVLSTDDVRFYRILVVPGDPGSRAAWERRKRDIERQLCHAVYQRHVSDARARDRMGETASTFGRYDFRASGTPRTSDDLALGWRVAAAVLENAWHEMGGLDLQYVDEPFAGCVAIAPEPLGPFFLPSQNLTTIIVWGTHMVFEYGDRVVAIDLEKKALGVT